MKRLTNRLTKLLALNRSAPREYRIENNAEADEATVFIYDVIGYDWWSDGGVTAKQFAKDLSAIKAKVIHLRINSPGGDVFEGRAMVAALQQHPAKKIGHVDGLAASAASFILMHCDEIEITDGAFIMIHNGWTIAIGDRHDFGETVALLEKIDGSITDDYEKRTSNTRAQITQWMDDETWFTAAEAVENGFADRVFKPSGDAGKTSARAKAWNTEAYEHPPADLVPEAAPAAPPAPAAPDTENADQNAAHAARLRSVALVETALA